MKWGFKKLISPALAFSLVSTATLSGSVVHGKQENKEEDSGLSVMDALSLAETIEKNAPEKQTKENEESVVKKNEEGDVPTHEDVKKLYNVYMLKMLKKATDSKSPPKTWVGRFGDEVKDLGKNIKTLMIGISFALAAGFVALPVVLGFLERCGMDLEEALYFMFPSRAEAKVKVEGMKLDNRIKALEYGSNKNLYDNWPPLYYFKEFGDKFVGVLAGIAALFRGGK